MKKNLLLLLTLVATTGSISAIGEEELAKRLTLNKDLIEDYKLCLDMLTEEHDKKHLSCDELKKQGASNLEIARCKIRSQDLIHKWEGNGCAAIDRVLHCILSEMKNN